MSRNLVDSLLAGKGISHSLDDPLLIETHISWVVLLGDFVYKIKKPVNLEFVDARSLSMRKHFCEEELRLNRRTAPEIYLEIVSFSGKESDPLVRPVEDDADGIFEYAVKMRRFPQSAILRNQATTGNLDQTVITACAISIAEFHGNLEKTIHKDYGSPDQVHAPVRANFTTLQQLLPNDKQAGLKKLRDWSENEFARIRADLNNRHRQGHVMECHGDLHLGNLLYLDQQCLAFDCVEFSQDLLWIDTASDIAFTIMDLESHELHDLAHFFLNQYLELTGDYSLLAVLPYYLVYRAMVRAKIAAIRTSQAPKEQEESMAECEHYLDRAVKYSVMGGRGLVLMCGLSGSGKTTIAGQIANATSFIHIRSDIERKRLFGIAALDSSTNSGKNIYTTDASHKTLEALLNLTQQILNDGFGVIVDATLIHTDWRDSLTALATKLALPWQIVMCEVDDDTARARLANRKRDASEATYKQYVDQKKSFDPFTESELAHLCVIDNTDSKAAEASIRMLQSLFAPSN